MHKNLPSSTLSRLMMSAETRLHLILFAVSVIYVCSAIKLAPPVVDGSLSPSFFPLLIGALATVFCSAQLLRDYKKIASQASPSVSRISGQLNVRAWAKNPVITLVLSTGIYITLFVPLGYLLSSALYTYAVILIFSDNKHLLKKALIALVITAIGYIVFQELFNVRLPTMWD